MNETGFFRRLVALCRKEFVQLWRDSSSLLIGTVLPILLIIIIGSGINLDVKNAPIAVVLEDASPTAQDAVSFLSGSAYFSPRYVTSRTEAVRLMDDREVNAILVVPADFSSKLGQREAKLQLIAYGTDPATATSINGYVEAGVAAFNAARVAGHAPFGMVTVENRMWFNDAHSSTWYFVPGLMMLITTIVGVFLTSLVMAREWERGTLESLFVTPVRKEELLLAKMIPYFCIAMLGFFLCLIASRFLYGVPLHGSFIMLVISSVLYLFVALGIGLLISAATKKPILGQPGLPRAESLARHDALGLPFRPQERPGVGGGGGPRAALHLLSGAFEIAVPRGQQLAAAWEELRDSRRLCRAAFGAGVPRHAKEGGMIGRVEKLYRKSALDDAEGTFGHPQRPQDEVHPDCAGTHTKHAVRLHGDL